VATPTVIIGHEAQESAGESFSRLLGCEDLELGKMAIKRLNWGCGPNSMDGWINSDQKAGPGIDLSGDIRDGLPLESDSLDYIVSIHALEEVPYPDLLLVLRELRRVLKPNGTLRLSLPDLDKGIQAYLRQDRDYFLIPDDEVSSVGGKLIVQLLWYGYSRTLFTYDFIEELLHKAGFRYVRQCCYRETSSPYAEIVELDNRERESLFVESTK
jgi:SAM-dependent methyltransferase